MNFKKLATCLVLVAVLSLLGAVGMGTGRNKDYILLGCEC